MSRFIRIVYDFWKVYKSLKVENLGVMLMIVLIEGGVGENPLAINFFMVVNEGLFEY